MWRLSSAFHAPGPDGNDVLIPAGMEEVIAIEISRGLETSQVTEAGCQILQKKINWAIKPLVDAGHTRAGMFPNLHR